MSEPPTDAEKIEMLIKAGRLYHDALDQCFALLIQYSRATKRDSIEPFFPSRSMMWGKMVKAKLMVDTVEAMQA
ncbi:MAG TPA: hypothetical protein VF748_07445, partial [Candidatus Acidoferrum sp.]